MRVLVLATLIVASCCSSAYAKSDQVTIGPVPSWVSPSELLPVPADAKGLAFIRRQDAIVHIDAQGQHQYDGLRFKVLHPNALQAGNIAITWNPAAGSPVVHAINVYRGSELINVLKSTSFEVLRREDQLEAARLDGHLTAILRVPDLRIGDELEIAYTVRVNDLTLGRKDFGVLFLGSDPSPGRYRLELSWEKGMEPKLQMTADMAAVANRQETAVQFRFDNPPMLIPPKDSPPRYKVQRLVEYSDYAEWAEVSRQFAPLFTRAATLDERSPLKAEVARIAASSSNSLERVSAVLKLVQQDVRYIYVGLNSGNFTPATADETWQRRYGDCKGKTALLLALLTELGIPAEAVLVNTTGEDDGLNERIPSPRLFDHVLVRAKIDGRLLYLDGTLPAVATPSESLVLNARWVLPVSANGSKLEHLEWRPARRPNTISLFDIDARAGFDAPAKVTLTSISRGIIGLQDYLQFSSVSPDQLELALRQSLSGSEWQTVETVKWHFDEKAQASILTINGTWTLDWDKDTATDRSISLPGGGFNPPARRGRSADQNQSAPFYNKPEYECRVTTLRVPSSTKLENWSNVAGFDMHIFGLHYYRAFDRRNGSIRMVRGYRVERDEIDAASALKDNDRISDFDNSMAYVYYESDTRTPLSTASKVVPSTDEIDWTSDSVSCLPN